MFSDLLDQFEQPTNRLYDLRRRLEASGERLCDLISGNVTSAGIRFPEPLLNRALTTGLKSSRIYRPHPFGQPTAREAISRYYKSLGHSVPQDHILLTPGTSLSYWYAFKLLANAGDEILFPQPSYPLIDSIASLTGLTVSKYPLRPGPRWSIDFEALESARTSRTKAIVLISPHNPTGAVATPDEIERLSQWAQRHALAIISDEVFSPFLWTDGLLPRPMGSHAPLVLTLNGFSKMLALPGIKLGWMAITGDSTQVGRALTGLEMISDTFLPVSEPVQNAVPALLKGSVAFQKSFLKEARRRATVLVSELEKIPRLTWTSPEGGFYVTVRLPEGCDDEAVSFKLLEKHRVVVHPGYFYDLEESHLVLSLVARPEESRRAGRALAEVLRGV